MWLERIALVSFFGLLTVLCICLNLDTPLDQRKDWFYVLAPLWWLYLILFVLLVVGWGEFFCIVCAQPDKEPQNRDARILDQRRRRRRPSDAADLLVSSVTLAVFVFVTILLACYLNGVTAVGPLLVLILIFYQIFLLAYLFGLSYYNTLRRRLNRKQLSYSTCISYAFRCGPNEEVTPQDEPFADLSVCGDAGLGRCKCAAGWAYDNDDDDHLTWIDAVQSFLLYILLIAFFVTSLFLLLAVTGHNIIAGVVLMPIYIAVAFLLLNSCCLCYQIARRHEEGYEWTTYTIYVVGLVLFLIFTILLAVQLDTMSLDTWFIVFFPIVLALFITAVGTCTVACCPACRRATGRDRWGVLARERTPDSDRTGLALETEFDDLAI